MLSHKNEDYNITTIKFHLENENSFINTCNIFKGLFLIFEYKSCGTHSVSS